MSKIIHFICSVILVICSVLQGIAPVFADKEGTAKPQAVGFELEPNDQPDKADWIYVDRAGYGKIQSGEDIDFWKMKATGDGTLTVSLDIPKGVNYRLQVFDDQKMEMAHSDKDGSSQEEIAAIPVKKDHWYYFASSSSEGNYDKKNYYMLRVTYIPVGLEVNPDSYEPNNSLSEAKLVSGNEYLEATIHDASDIDYYRLEYQLGSTINLALSEIPSGMDLDLYLLDSQFNPVMKSKSAKNANETISFQGDPGTYYVKVEFNNRSTLVMNKYRLRVTVSTMPVILIPGIGGSRLSKLEQGTVTEAWLNLTGMTINDNYHVRNLSLTPKAAGSDQVVQLHPELSIIPEEGDEGFHAIEFLHYGSVEKIQSMTEEYYSMAQHLQSLGYKKGLTLFGFPYDWRLSSSKNSAQLKQTIDRALKNSGAKQVQLVVHSMGGVLVKETLLSNPSYQQKVRKIIYMGTPFLGSPRAYQALRTGYNFEIPIIFSDEAAQRISQYAPAVFELLPSREYVKRQNFLYLRDGEQKLKQLSYQDLYSNPKVNLIYQPLLKAADSLHSKWDSRQLKVPQYSIIGDGQYTPLGFEVRAGTNQLVPFFDQGEGDGTVPAVSSSYSLKDEIKKKFYVTSSHIELPKNWNVINQVVNLLKGIEKTLNGLRDKPQAAVNQQDYLVIYREDGEFPELSLQVGDQTQVIQKLTANQKIEQLKQDEGKQDLKIEYYGNVVVIFLPVQEANHPVKMTPMYQVGNGSGIVIERHHVNKQTQKDNVTNHSINTNGESMIE